MNNCMFTHSRAEHREDGPPEGLQANCSGKISQRLIRVPQLTEKVWSQTESVRELISKW